MCVNTNIYVKKTIQDLSLVAWTVTSNGQSADQVGIKDRIYKGLVLIYQKKTEIEAGQEKTIQGMAKLEDYQQVVV